MLPADAARPARPARPAPPASSSVDQVGAATLERMAAAPRYNRWMFERLSPWVGHRVLEVGAGIGNMSAFLTDRERLVLTDTEPYYLGRLRECFGGRPNVRIVELRLPAFDPQLVAERVDTVLCLNVLEHIEQEEASLTAMRHLLDPGGRLVLLVPALRSLYGTLDQALGHFRRYARRELVRKLDATGFRVRHVEYFNLGGALGWWLASRVLRRPMISTAALRWYEALVPLLRLERWLPWRVGQSLIAIGEVRG